MIDSIKSKKTTKILIVTLMLAMLFSLASCGDKGLEKGKNVENAKIAMILNGEKIKDNTFDKELWLALDFVSKENDIKAKYVSTKEPSSDNFMLSIDKAIKEGAEFVVLPGRDFETTCFNAQVKYPDTKFLLVDGVPHDTNNKYATSPNTVSVIFAEEDAGFLAGYASVKEGYTNLAYLGDSTYQDKRYEDGYIQGAAYAAEEMKKKINLQYQNIVIVDKGENITEAATAMYNEKIEVIFTSTGTFVNPMIKASEKNKGKIIGVDLNLSRLSDTIITSAQKDIEKILIEYVGSYANDDFVGGAAFNYTAENDGVRLEMDNARFIKFKKQDYDNIYSKLRTREIEVKKDAEVAAVTDLSGKWVSLVQK